MTDHDVPLCQKFVRDEMPVIRCAAGWKVSARQMTDWLEIEWRCHLKLLEELREFQLSPTRRAEVEEMVDLIALRSAIEFHKVSIDPELLAFIDELIARWQKFFAAELAEARTKKAAVKGEFLGLWVIDTEVRDIA
jgi:predicted house-cleaning noncanonical NTP pyrophosphatase (MazG superfamily)